jgi:hypothetical protein
MHGERGGGFAVLAVLPGWRFCLAGYCVFDHDVAPAAIRRGTRRRWPDVIHRCFSTLVSRGAAPKRG